MQMTSLSFTALVLFVFKTPSPLQPHMLLLVLGVFLVWQSWMIFFLTCSHNLFDFHEDLNYGRFYRKSMLDNNIKIKVKTLLVWQGTPTILVLEKLRQGGHEFKVSLGSIVSPRPACAIKWDCILEGGGWFLLINIQVEKNLRHSQP